MCHLICMEVMEEQMTFIFSFFSVCACSRLVVASASLGNSVSASSVPNACRVCAVVFTIRANASIACREGSAALKPESYNKNLRKSKYEENLNIDILLKHSLKVHSVYCTCGCVFLQCGGRSSFHGGTPVFLPALLSVVQDQCRHGAQSLNSALLPKKNAIR